MTIRNIRNEVNENPGAQDAVVERWPIDHIIPYDRNPRINDKAVDHVLESLKKHGQVRPIIVSAPGHPFEKPVLCCGHTTLRALKKYGATEVMVQVHAFESEAEFVDYNIRDNKTHEFATWDENELVALGAEFNLDLGQMGFDLDEVLGKDELYTAKITSPVYEPTGPKPSVSELFDDEKTRSLESAIRESDISDEDKAFLIAAAQRHRVFNYEKIANFYAQSTPEVQRLMEDSALVIIDFEKAIANGYVRLTERIKQLYLSDTSGNNNAGVEQ